MTPVHIAEPGGGWGHPWLVVFELTRTCGESFVLVGGLMVQLHSMIANIGELRPTDDVDLLVDVLSDRSRVGAVVAALRAAGFRVREPLSTRAPIHRFERGLDVVDVLVPDHQLPAPRLGGRPIMAIDGGTQALGKLLTVTLEVGNEVVTMRIPDPLGGMILKAAAHRADNRDRERHLRDAALLAAALDDPLAARGRLVGSDRRRLLYLSSQLEDPYAGAWQLLPEAARRAGHDALAILTAR